MFTNFPVPANQVAMQFKGRVFGGKESPAQQFDGPCLFKADGLTTTNVESFFQDLLHTFCRYLNKPEAETVHVTTMWQQLQQELPRGYALSAPDAQFSYWLHIFVEKKIILLMEKTDKQRTMSLHLFNSNRIITHFWGTQTFKLEEYPHSIPDFVKEFLITMPPSLRPYIQIVEGVPILIDDINSETNHLVLRTLYNPVERKASLTLGDDFAFLDWNPEKTEQTQLNEERLRLLDWTVAFVIFSAIGTLFWGFGRIFGWW